MKPLTHGSLFSGLDAPSLAAEWMGWQTAFHCEINPFCQKILKYYYPDSEIYGDITKTDFTPWAGRIDVLTGGFPCQPFSVAGKRAGTEDMRFLWPQMLRAIREIRPTWIIAENVAGILTMVQPGTETPLGSQSALFDAGERHRVRLEQQYVGERICRDIEREGYTIQPIVIPACSVGAPHERYRVWFVGHRVDSDTDLDRQWKRTDEQVDEQGSGGTADTGIGCKDGHAAYAQRRRGDEVDHEVQPQQPNGAGINSNGVQRDATHSADTGTESLRRTGQDSVSEAGYAAHSPCPGRGELSDESRAQGARHRHELLGEQRAVPDWQHFPTQPPVCSRDDGLSTQLHGISFSEWRRESVKAYGNSMVTGVVLELFRAIAQVEEAKKRGEV